MRRSDAHEYRRAYNAQAVVCAEGSQLIVEHGIVTTTADSASFAATILSMGKIICLPRTALAYNCRGIAQPTTAQSALVSANRRHDNPNPTAC